MESQPKIISKELKYQGKFISFYHYNYVNKGKTCTWETIKREKKVPNSIHGTKAVPIIFKSKRLNITEPHVIIIANYRIPIDNYIIEFPAGMTDGTESADICTMREVKEETGFYVKRVLTEFNPTNLVSYCDPWKSDDNEVLQYVEVDPDEERNLNPKQELDDDECIEVYILPLKTIRKEVEKLVSEKKYALDNQVMGLVMAMSLSI